MHMGTTKRNKFGPRLCAELCARSGFSLAFLINSTRKITRQSKFPSSGKPVKDSLGKWLILWIWIFEVGNAIIKNGVKFRYMSSLNLVWEIRIFSARIYIEISSRQYGKLQFLMVEICKFLPGWCVRRWHQMELGSFD